MLVIIVMSLLYYKGSCHEISTIKPTSKELVKCVTDIVAEYFASQKILTYVGNKLDDEDFLKAIHELNLIAMMSRRTSHKLPVPHQGYFISAKSYRYFVENFPKLSTESTWNPEARFLIVVRDLEYLQLEHIFDRLLSKHVNNVIVVNATSEAHIYTYNPFENYGCGKRYDEIVSYGKCSEMHTQDLFPYKFVTGLRNCTFGTVIPHYPPYTILVNRSADTPPLLKYGVEPYLLHLVAEMKGFTIELLDKKFAYTYSTVSADMVAAGPLQMLQTNETDIIFGGLLLAPSRAVAFSYIYDFFPYIDEIRYLVKHASYVPVWKYIYLEFDGTVWLLIILSLVCYSTVMILLLRPEDKSLVVLKLLGNFLLYGANIQCQSAVKYIFIIWVWFAYLINSFYQSSLVSFITNPVKEPQILTEADIIRNNLKPCFSDFMDRYTMETTLTPDTHIPIPGCKAPFESITKVMESKEYYTVFPYGQYKYNIDDFMDSDGKPKIYTLKKPYSKIIYCMYFYKGFPLISDLRSSAIRIRELGFVNKALSDIKNTKYRRSHVQSKDYVTRFEIPWRVYIFGCIAAAITLIVEILLKCR